MKSNSFTLIELLIVIVIVAILAGAMVPMFRTSRYAAQVARVQKDVEAIKMASHLMHVDTGTWPEFWHPPLPEVYVRSSARGIINNQDWYENPIPGWNGPYLDEWKNDPWGNPYRVVYCWPTTTYAYLYIASDGPDGRNLCIIGGTCGPNGLSSCEGYDDILLLIAKINPEE